jgi:hypothetical protein
MTCDGCNDYYSGICLANHNSRFEDQLCPCQNCLIKMTCKKSCKPYKTYQNNYHNWIKENDYFQ